MAGYTKLFGSILDSTVWEASPEIRIVWITMLAMADRDGNVEASVPGLAKRAAVDRAYVEQALALFTAPDPDSRTKDFEGRRIEEIDGGWHLLNHGKYREKASAEEYREKAAARQKRAREKRAAAEPVTLPVTPSHDPSRSVTPVTAGHAIAAPPAAPPATQKEPSQSGAGFAEHDPEADYTWNRRTLEREVTDVRGGKPWSVPTNRYALAQRADEVVEQIRAFAAAEHADPALVCSTAFRLWVQRQATAKRATDPHLWLDDWAGALPAKGAA